MKINLSGVFVDDQDRALDFYARRADVTVDEAKGAADQGTHRALRGGRQP